MMTPTDPHSIPLFSLQKPQFWARPWSFFVSQNIVELFPKFQCIVDRRIFLYLSRKQQDNFQKRKVVRQTLERESFHIRIEGRQFVNPSMLILLTFFQNHNIRINIHPMFLIPYWFHFLHHHIT